MNKLFWGLNFLTSPATGLLMCGATAALAQSPVSFQDVTQRAGIADRQRQAFSVSWVDYNNDGRPDIWLSRHTYADKYVYPSLFINQGNGIFKDIGMQVWPWKSAASLPLCNNSTDHCIDAHGSSWVDFDNDGDQDLLIPVGDDNGKALNPSLFLINEFGALVNKAEEYNLDYPAQRGRAAVWYDWNQDGLLDVYIAAEPRTDVRAPSELFENQENIFLFASSEAGLHDDNVDGNFAQYADVTGDGILDLFIHTDSWHSDPVKVYDTSTRPYTDITASFPKIKNVNDAAIADFNNDLYQDIFFVRNNPGPGLSSWKYQQNNRLAGFLLVANSAEVGFTLKTDGNLLFDVRDCCNDAITTSNVFIGTAGRQPTGFPISLSATDPTVKGIKAHNPGQDGGFYIGYDPTTQIWKVLLSSSSEDHLFKAWIRVETSTAFSQLTTIGSNFESPPTYSPVLLLYDPALGSYVDKTTAAGLSKPILGTSVSAADFNNDGFLDLFISGGDPIKKTPNILYLNRGNGTFSLLANAGGAAGPTVGPHNTSNQLEIGSKVAVADFNGDGFIDILTTNTLWRNLNYLYYAVQPNKLYQNNGNNNHWVAFNLRGTRSNRNAIGARVYLTSAGKTQLREQQSGMHLFSQDSQRIHFGLGESTNIDRVDIHWPSGVEQTLTNVTSVDRTYLITEP